MAIPFLEFNHICILVKDVDKAVKDWMEFLGVTEEDCYPMEMDVPEEDTWVRGYNVPAGNGAWIQLVQPMAPKGGMWDHLQKRGEGPQHICFTCPESLIDGFVQEVKDRGPWRWIFPEPRGPQFERYIMTHPKDSSGIIIEILSKGWDRDWQGFKAAQKRW
jgi:methylmalonyl-CoA/ethylmalonyl-CoA epimerase